MFYQSHCVCFIYAKGVPRVLGNDHYKLMPHVTVGVARERTLTAQWPRVPSIGQHLQPFTVNGDISTCPT